VSLGVFPMRSGPSAQFGTCVHKTRADEARIEISGLASRQLAHLNRALDGLRGSAPLVSTMQEPTGLRIVMWMLFEARETESRLENGHRKRVSITYKFERRRTP